MEDTVFLLLFDLIVGQLSGAAPLLVYFPWMLIQNTWRLPFTSRNCVLAFSGQIGCNFIQVCKSGTFCSFILVFLKIILIYIFKTSLTRNNSLGLKSQLE